jgi:ATP-dependent helicase/nuclease subunit A
MNKAPTPEQLGVIESTESQLMVTASAGAGKTFVLVERYLWLVDNLALEPHQILTITFTRKAAAEMKERIVARLRERGQFDRAQVAETGPIQTIHSFCERLLRENSLAAGIDPDFEIMDEGERARLTDASIAKAIARIREDEPDAEQLLRLLAGKRDHGESSPYARLEKSVAQVLQGLRGTQVTLEDLEPLSDPIQLGRTLDERLMASVPAEVAQAFRFASEGGLADRLKQAFKAAGHKSPPFLMGKFDEETREESLHHTAGLIRLAILAWGEMEHQMARRQQVDYALLESMAVRLLRDSEPTRRRIASQYGAVMVDEAQDVNPVQHQLLDSLGVPQIMIVGDEKQSIYGFRLADVELFRKRGLQMETLKLTKNFRSDEGILRFVDDLFEPMWQEVYERMGVQAAFDPDVVEEPDYSGVEIWEMPDRDVGQTAQLIVDMGRDAGLELGKVTVLTRYSRYANELHQRFQAMGVKSRVVGGTEKFYVRLEVRDLANLLKALSDPYDDFALLAVLRSPIAGVSLDGIALLGLNKPVVEAMGSVQLNRPEDAEAIEKFRAWFDPLRQKADKLAAWEVLAEILAKSDYLVGLARRRGGERMIANVRKLFALAAKEPELGPIEYAEQIREIQRLAHKEGDAPADDDDDQTLTIMTIHKAKGLEFEAVVIPDVHGRIGARADAVEVDARLGLVATKFGSDDNVYRKWLGQRRREREIAEEMRVLYVAMTRAKKRLCVVAHGKPRNPNSIAGFIGKELGLGREPSSGVTRRTPDASGTTPPA